MTQWTFERLADEYRMLWAGMAIRPERLPEVNATARQIAGNRERYMTVQERTGVPWYVVGMLHSMECDLSFKKHLHNGDKLDRPTVNVPAGRGPFATWEDSAVDALTMKGKEFNKITDWSLERIAYSCELYNGFGYRLPSTNVHSPYLWSFTTAYKSGKYVRDHVWSAVAVSTQCGALALLRALVDAGEIPNFDHVREEVHPWPKAPAPEPAQVSLIKSAAESKTTRWSLGALGAWVSEKLGLLQDVIPDVTSDVQSTLDPLQSLLGLMRVNASKILVTLAVICAAVAIVKHIIDRTELKRMKAMHGDNT